MNTERPSQLLSKPRTENKYSINNEPENKMLNLMESPRLSSIDESINEKHFLPLSASLDNEIREQI